MVAVSVVAGMDKAAATDSLLPLLEDPVIDVRIEVARMLGFYAPPSTAQRLRVLLDARKQKMTANEIASDSSLKFGEVAIKRLERRQIDPTYDAVADDTYNGSYASGDTP
jgi:hypothetical protein